MESSSCKYIGLCNAQAGIDGGIAETMHEEVKVCLTRVGVVGISGLDVAGTTNGIEHCLQLGNNEPEVHANVTIPPVPPNGHAKNGQDIPNRSQYVTHTFQAFAKSFAPACSTYYMFKTMINNGQNSTTLCAS